MEEDANKQTAAYSAAILNAVTDASPDGVIDMHSLLDSLKVITAMTVVCADDDWTAETIQFPADAYAKALVLTMVNMIAARRAGMRLPFDKPLPN